MTEQRDTRTAVVTGASAGLGAAYARRLAERGYDLVLVARDQARLEAFAAEIVDATGVRVDAIAADLSDTGALEALEQRLRTDATVDLLVNNAGGAAFGPLAAADASALERMVTLNVTALTRLTTAVVGPMVARGHGDIVNVSSALALNVLPASAVYSGTKSYVLTFTQSLQQELAGTGVRAQVVLPGALRTGFWGGSGIELEDLPGDWIMSTDDAADAALAGLDSGESVTILSLPDDADWQAYDAARQALIPRLSLVAPAGRYRNEV